MAPWASGTGPLTRKLQDLYFGVCKGENDRYADWLTPIV